MGFFREAYNFSIEGDNAPPPNVPQILAEVAHIVQNVSSSLPSGRHFQGTLQAMDENTLRYLRAELSQKDATLRAMNEPKAREAEGARIAGMQYPNVGGSGSYGTGNGGIQTLPPQQIPLGLPPPGICPSQGMNPMMLPNTLSLNAPLQGPPSVPQQMNIPPQGFPPSHPIGEPNGNPLNVSYFHGPHSMQNYPGHYMLPTYPPAHVQHQQHPYPKVADPVELDEEVETDEQSKASSHSANDSNDNRLTRTNSFAREG